MNECKIKILKKNFIPLVTVRDKEFGYRWGGRGIKRRRATRSI
jgi:hypothetical protein